MALPTQSDLITMDYSYQGQPFVNVSAKSGIDLTTMDYSYLGQPFVGNPFGSPPPLSTNTTNFFMMF